MIYIVDDLRIDGIAFELRRKDLNVAIEPRAMELILLLLRDHRRMLTKQQLMLELWPGSHVLESSLTRCVHIARRALGSPKLILNIYGRGYRWGAVNVEAMAQASVMDMR